MEFYGDAPAFDLTYSDVFLVPRRSGVGSRLEVDLSPRDGTAATVPLVSSNFHQATRPCMRLSSTSSVATALVVEPKALVTVTV